MSDRDEKRQMVRPYGQENWISTEGSEMCSGTGFDWSFSMDSKVIVARLVQDHGYSKRDAEEELRLWFDERLREGTFEMISEFLCLLDAGVIASFEPDVIAP